MNIPNALYNSPTTVPLGFIAGFAILIVAGAIAWRAGSTGLQQKLRTMLTAIGFAVTGFIVLGTTTHLLLVQLNSSPASMIAVSLHFAAMLALTAALVAAVIKRTPIGTAGAVWLLAMTFATFAELNQFWSLGDFDGSNTSDSWAFGATMGWAGVAITGLALAVTGSVVAIKAYGDRQFKQGQLAGLDASQQQDKMALDA